MLNAVELALRGLEYASIEEADNTQTQELVELELQLHAYEEDVEDTFETYKRIKTTESKQRYETALVNLSKTTKAITDLRSSNMTIVLNMEDQALLKHQAGIEAASSVISSCFWDSLNDFVEITSLSKRKSKFWLDSLEAME